MDQFYRGQNQQNFNSSYQKETSLESKLNMYERQIDQLFEFSYRDQDDIKALFKIKDDLYESLNKFEKKYSDAQLTELKQCITNYYYLEIANKKRIEDGEYYQFQLFIFQICIICYLIYLRF